MRLFRSRATALVEQHLERKGIDEVWWPSAKAAIAHCEQRQWFEPVFTASGPVAARSVVALLELEPFVQGGVDWDAHPNPFLNDPASRHFYDQRLNATIERWEELYGEEENSTLADTDLHQALVFLRDLTAQSPNEGASPTERALNVVWSLGSAGYCWRLAEEQVHGLPDEDYLRKFNGIWRSFPEDPPRATVGRDRLLFWGAAEAANRVQTKNFRPWDGCPGGFAVQFDYFEDGFARVCEGIVPDDVEISRPDLWYAWCFGITLRDSEHWLDEHPA